MIGTDGRFLSIYGRLLQKIQISCGVAGVQGWLKLTGETMYVTDGGKTRNQFVGNHTRVRIPPAAPEKKPVFDLGQKRVSCYFGGIIFDKE
ncbi:MAG: hypothetical protein ACLRQ4_21565 [Neglectibacter timonensis]